MEGGISTKRKVITICVAVLAFLIALGLISRTMDGGLSKVNFDM